MAGLAGGGSEPEFLLVFRNASSNSESAVAVESEEESSSLLVGGGGGDRRPADSLRGISGECGGVWILTFFLVNFVLPGAVQQTVSLWYWSYTNRVWSAAIGPWYIRGVSSRCCVSL